MEVTKAMIIAWGVFIIMMAGIWFFNKYKITLEVRTKN